MAALRHIFRDQRGAAAVELAIIAPVLAGLALVSLEIWQTGAAQQKAAAALDVATDYYMNGGLDDATAVQAALDGWLDRPEGATVTSARLARCGDAPADPTQVCGDGRMAAIYVALEADSTREGAIYSARVRATRTVRVR